MTVYDAEIEIGERPAAAQKLYPITGGLTARFVASSARNQRISFEGEMLRLSALKLQFCLDIVNMAHRPARFPQMLGMIG